ncbi:MAG: aldo/keto reductase [Proteobacteria bacterium]|nr:aldo/keto reductase [Pseudomonadota bacterium]MBU1709429.1 aldo/keto reductase [Pseudomonadota bacterium]
MSDEQQNMKRRDFLKAIGAAGMGSLLGPGRAMGSQGLAEGDATATTAKFPQVPRRILGKTGIQVPCLWQGFHYDLLDKQLVLRKSLEWGVTHWNTAYSYSNGNSELGIGKFFEKNPQARKEVFLVTKASKVDSIDDVEKRLQASLKRMNTEYIDLYYGVHGMSEPKQFTGELRHWAESAKKRGLIRYFGVSIHENTTECLTVAAKLDWIDAIMMRYNFRLTQDKKLNKAIDACHKAGIGLIAMKTQAKETWFRLGRKLTDHFLESGYTEGQAKLKVVLEDKRFAAVCISMPSIALLTTNVAAALDRLKLSQVDRTVLAEYADETGRGYCAGCSNICNKTVPEAPYISDVMRFLMYYNGYGEKENARKLYGQIPYAQRQKLLNTDFSRAESLCPQQVAIGEFMKQAGQKLG